MEIFIGENMVAAKTAATAVSRSFTPFARETRISFVEIHFSEKKEAYTTTTERKSFGEPFWPLRKPFQAGGGYKNPIKTRKTISTTEIFPLWTPFIFSAKKSSALEQGGVWFLFPSFSHTVVDCVNSSPPLIFRKFLGFGGIWAISGKFEKFRENSGEFSGIQWGFVWRLIWIQWEFLGGFGATPDFQEVWVFGVVSGDLGPQKAFAQIATTQNQTENLQTLGSGAESGSRSTGPKFIHLHPPPLKIPF